MDGGAETALREIVEDVGAGGGEGEDAGIGARPGGMEVGYKRDEVEKLVGPGIADGECEEVVVVAHLGGLALGDGLRVQSGHDDSEEK